MAGINIPEDNSQPQKSKIEIVTDEDWKSRVKAEDKKLDAASQSTDVPQSAGNAGELSDDEEGELHMPDATFFTMIQMFSTQAVVAMGLIPGPEGETHVEPSLAKHFIDLLGILEKKCDGNLTAQESQFLSGTLHELRMAFVDVSKRAGS
ncbi:DUF1844 domain-containing protein [Planctomicrobium sp. SH527]|uniref:DUF1844 domain-containing protein n=1 Tax=Planctomicrobium sp. SH527 TaxID=3448123 RepID=UPI003F5CB035